MNERAVELYREACEFAYGICKQEGRTGGPSDHIWNTLSTGRFAELIVRECCQFEKTYGGDASLVARSFSRKIREHFGVEE